MNLSIIILYTPNGEKERKQNFEFLNKYMRDIFPDAEFIIAKDPTNYPNYCRSHSINHGVRQSTGENLLIMDSDIYISKELILRGLKLLESSPFVIPFGIVRDLLPPISEQVVNGEEHTYKELERWGYRDRDIRRDKMAGGLQLFKRNFFDQIGGYDERFIYWGYEDTYLCQKVKKELGDYPIIEDGVCYHLYHNRKQDWHKNKKLYEKLLEELYET